MKPNPHLGKLIVFEGLDGSGQTTQAQLLAKWFKDKRNQLAYYTKEPSDGPIGSLLKLVLSNRLVCTNGTKKPGPLDEITMALFFAADRADHLYNEIMPKLKNGIHVIADRYYLSSLAYQSMGVEYEWIKQINKNALQPDLTFYLDVPATVCVQRMHAQRWHQELYEDVQTLSKVQQNYLDTIRKLKSTGERIEILDGNQPPKDVHRATVRALKSFLRASLIKQKRKPSDVESQMSLLAKAPPLTQAEIASRQDG